MTHRSLGQAAPTLRLVIELISIGYGLSTTSFVLARAVLGERWNLVAFFNNFVPWLALGAACVIAAGLVSSRRRWLIPLQLPVLAVFLLCYGEQFWPKSIERPPDAAALSVATYNVFEWASNPDRVVDVIEALDADVVALHELTAPQAMQITARLAESYPYRTLHPDTASLGAGLLSRFPILEQHDFRPGVRSNTYLRVVLNVYGTPIVVYVAHPPSPRGRAFPLTYNTESRDRELGLLFDRLEQETAPLLVLCDCNMSDQTRMYERFAGFLRDAFREAGWGMGFTLRYHRDLLHVLPPFLRIDYVWYSSDFTALSAHVGDDSGTSDHLPVVARLALDAPLAQAIAPFRSLLRSSCLPPATQFPYWDTQGQHEFRTGIGALYCVNG